MKKFLNVLLASLLMASMVSISAYAGYDDPDVQFPIEIDITSGNPDIADVDVKVTPVNSTDGDIELYEDVTSEEKYLNEDLQPRAYEDDDVEVSFGIVNGYTTVVRGQYYPNNGDLLAPLASSYFDGRVYKFTMPDGRVHFDVKYNKNSLSPLGSDDNWIPKANYEDPSPAPMAATTENVKQSVLPAGTISMVAKTGVNLSSVTGAINKNVIIASARPLEMQDDINQKALLENLAKLENFDYEVLASYGIYAATNLAPEDFGKKTDFSWKNISDTNIPKNAKIKAICFNCYEGYYVIDGEIDELGNIIFKDYIIRPNKTNITVFLVK